MAKRSVRDLSVSGRNVLIRADLNVPLSEDRRITDDRRIRMFLPTLQQVVESGGRAIVMSHLGRPSGNTQEDQAAFSLRPVADRIQELLGKSVAFAPDCVSDEARRQAESLADGGVLLLENLRFHAAETIIDRRKKNPDGKLTADQDRARTEFASALAALGTAYVNDAFGACHRNHVSMYDLPQRMEPGNRVVGLLVEKELAFLGDALEAPTRPFVAILGGAKVSDKIGVIRNLVKRVDQVLIGGAMAYTFLAAKGHKIGNSLCEQDQLETARELIQLGGDKLHLPSDSIVAAELRSGAATQTVGRDIPEGYLGLDIGPDTSQRYCRLIAEAKTIVWNGPMGVFEKPPFDRGTREMAKAIAQQTDGGATTVIGGGDSAAAIEQAGLADRVTHISTGGGASLKFLEGKKFDSVAVLDDA